MTEAIESKTSTAEEKSDRKAGMMIPASFRADLVMQKQLFRKEEYYVVKDPLALTYFRLRTEEAYLVTLLDGTRRLSEIQEICQERFPHGDYSLGEINNFIHQLGVSGLLNINARRFVDYAQSEKRMKVDPIKVWLKLLSNLIFFKVPLFDPSPWLGKVTHAMRFLWSRWFVLGSIAFIVSTLFWLFLNRDTFSGSGVEFFTPSNIALLWLSVIVIKTFHEFGHAMTCRHFGGEVHEMGACLICLTPCGYVDASDAWMMRHRRHKIYTTVAGIFAEFFIASVAAHVWLNLQDGLARNLAFNAMIVASINTLFFNLNPFMRFDGYYIALDLFEIPNLRAKAFAYCSTRLQRLIFGIRNTTQERLIEDANHGRLFIVYSVCAFSYMLIVIYSIGQIFSRVLEPIGLKVFGDSIGIAVQVSFVMIPILKVVSDSMNPESRIEKSESTTKRLGLIALIVVCLVGLLAVVPSHFKVSQQGIVLSQHAEEVGIEIAGTIEGLFVQTGDWVEEGQLLARLKNPSLDSLLSTSQTDMELAKVRLMSLKTSDAWDDHSSIPEAAAAFESSIVAYERAQQLAQKLELRSPTQGYILTPDIERLTGAYLPAHASVFRIGDTRRMKIVIPLTEDQAQLVEVGSSIDGRWQATGKSFQSRIEVLPRRKTSREEYLPGMLAVHGGPAPREPSQADSQNEPEFSIFLAEALLPESEKFSHEGMRVRTYIEGKKTTVGARIWRGFLNFWNRRG